MTKDDLKDDFWHKALLVPFALVLLLGIVFGLLVAPLVMGFKIGLECVENYWRWTERDKLFDRR